MFLPTRTEPVVFELAVAAHHFHRPMDSSLPPPASKGTVEAAKAAASGPHATINLKRVVLRLELRSRAKSDDDDGQVRWEDLTLDQLRTEWQTVCYARVLYDELERER